MSHVTPDAAAARRAARAAVRDFLTTRRARRRPADVGLPAGPRRRVPGLRREEVALLAGISVEYYAKLERGDAGGMSPSVQAALGRVLDLDDVERAHFAGLVRNLGAPPTPAREAGTDLRPGLRRLPDLLPSAAAFLRTGRLDVLAANARARALYADLWDGAPTPAGDIGPGDPGEPAPPNLARYVFLDPRSREFYDDWAGQAAAAVGSLRAAGVRAPTDARLRGLIAELTSGSPQFAQLWARHDVDYYRTGEVRFHHRTAGDLTLAYEALEVAADPGLTLLVYSAEPGSPAAAALARLG